MRVTAKELIAQGTLFEFKGYDFFELRGVVYPAGTEDPELFNFLPYSDSKEQAAQRILDSYAKDAKQYVIKRGQ